MLDLQALGVALVDLPESQIADLQIADQLRDAVLEAKHIKSHEGRRRQLQYIGRLMRSVDPEPIREKLKAWDGVSAGETARLHRIERWREKLIEDDGALGALADAHPGIDTQRLRALVRNTREERNAGRPPRAYRELFRALREIVADAASTDDAS